MAIWTVRVQEQEIEDLAVVHQDIITQFGHVDQGGKVTGLSLRADELRIHFENEPSQEDMTQIAAMFNVLEATYEQE